VRTIDRGRGKSAFSQLETAQPIETVDDSNVETPENRCERELS